MVTTGGWVVLVVVVVRVGRVVVVVGRGAAVVVGEGVVGPAPRSVTGVSAGRGLSPGGSVPAVLGLGEDPSEAGVVVSGSVGPPAEVVVRSTSLADGAEGTVVSGSPTATTGRSG